MAEFEMNVDPYDPRWQVLDSFTKGYIEAMFFADGKIYDMDGNETGDEFNNYGFSAISDVSLGNIVADCVDFQYTYTELLEKAYEHMNYEPNRAGNDLWYSRQGHGTGFWDRGLGNLGDALTNAARLEGERYPYLGDDLKIYYE